MTTNKLRSSVPVFRGEESRNDFLKTCWFHKYGSTIHGGVWNTGGDTTRSNGSSCTQGNKTEGRCQGLGLPSSSVVVFWVRKASTSTKVWGFTTCVWDSPGLGFTQSGEFGRPLNPRYPS